MYSNNRAWVVSFLSGNNTAGQGTAANSLGVTSVRKVEGPGVTPGATDLPVSTRRIFFTLLDWAGLGVEHSLRGTQEEMVLGEARGGAVVEHDAVLAQHQAVARSSDREGREAIRVEAIEEGGRIGPLDVDLPERRDVAQAHRSPDGERLARGRRGGVLAGLRIVLRPQPVPRLEEHGALALMPGVDRGATGRLVVAAARMAGTSAVSLVAERIRMPSN